MKRSSDLAPLIVQSSGKGLAYRQGTVVTWDQDTAENTVLVGGSLLTNLPVLNSTEANLLAPGDVVGIIVSGASWAIIGRLIIPGTPEAATAIRSITNRIVAAQDVTNGTRTSNTYGDLSGSGVGPEVEIRIGTSGRALAFWSCEMGQITNGGPVQYSYRITPHVSVELSGANTEAASDWNALNYNIEHPGPGFVGEALTSFWAQNGTLHLFEGLDPGLTTFTMKYRSDGINPSSGAVAHFSAREIAVFAL